QGQGDVAGARHDQPRQDAVDAPAQYRRAARLSLAATAGDERKPADRRCRRRTAGRRWEGAEMTSGSVFRIGLLRLTDAAPLIIAHELGHFAGENVEVRLSLEPSWANIADKLAFGLLDGAMLLPPLALALHLGLSGAGGPEALIVPAALSL